MGINSILMNNIIDEFIERMKTKGNGIISFGANTYYFDGEPDIKDGGEGYKLGMAITARKTWNKQKFTHADIGNGKIGETAITLLRKTAKNLVYWRNVEAFSQYVKSSPAEAEKLIYDVFNSPDAEAAFNALTEKVRQYDIVSTLFFFRDYTTFLPLRSEIFGKIFSNLGIDFTLSSKMSWDNYTTYLGYIRQIRDLLSTKFDGDVTMLDAHSFLWIMQDSEYFAKGNTPHGVEHSCASTQSC